MTINRTQAPYNAQTPDDAAYSPYLSSSSDKKVKYNHEADNLGSSFSSAFQGKLPNYSLDNPFNDYFGEFGGSESVDPTATMLSNESEISK